MTSLLIRNAQVVTLDDENGVIAGGSVYVEDDRIVDVGNLDAEALDPDRIIDAGGRLLMPGLIIAHHHLYSTFARGFTPPGPPATNFDQNLRFLWWKLDAALDSDDVYYSALLALMDAALAGCTTVIDHHASPSVCDGSLDWVERAFTDVGLSGCLCYEVSDRNQPGEGIEENERFIRKCKDSDSDQVTAMFGLHASMTLGDDTLDRCAVIGNALDAGFHVHAAEDAIDVEATRERHGKRVLDRFHERGMTGHKSIFVHGTHLEPAEMKLLAETDSMLVSNPESNMNNGLGVAPILDMLKHGVLVGVGFPIAITLSWFLEFRDGNAVLDDLSPQDRRRRRFGRTYISIVSALAAAAALVWVFRLMDMFPGPETPATAVTTPDIPIAENSIAVLPFFNNDGSDETQIFANGLMDDVITRL